MDRGADGNSAIANCSREPYVKENIIFSFKKMIHTIAIAKLSITFNHFTGHGYFSNIYQTFTT
jgi:hypothetical protein